MLYEVITDIATSSGAGSSCTRRTKLELLGALYHLSKDEANRRIGELLKLVELESHADRPAKTYSGGMKRKLDIACGLLPDPKILFLDEPTLGLDVQSRLRIWDYVRIVITSYSIHYTKLYEKSMAKWTP